LQRTEHDAEVARAALVTSEHAIEAANAEEQQLYSKVKGELGVLIKEEEARQARLAAERAQRAIAAAAARARAEQAARDAASHHTVDTSTGDAPSGRIVGRNPRVQAALDRAIAQLGKPYVYAGGGPDAFDCSGLTMYAWEAAGVSLPHNALAQYESLPHVPISSVQAGDLVFFGSPIHHVGMVVGPGTMIEAPHTGAVVRYASYYRPDIVGAARVP
jgi:cell wall-associated NlpC family hydrolase